MSQRAIVMFPAGEGLAAMESIRRRHDPQASLIGAHVTLVFPFQSKLSVSALRAHLAECLRGVTPFHARFDNVTAADGEYVFLEPTRGGKQMVALHGRLHTGVLKEHLSAVHQYLPHVTLGGFRMPSSVPRRWRTFAGSRRASRHCLAKSPCLILPRVPWSSLIDCQHETRYVGDDDTAGHAGSCLLGIRAPSARLGPPFIRERLGEMPLTVIGHLGGGLVVLAVGAWQLNARLGARVIQLHRWMGRIYVVTRVRAA